MQAVYDIWHALHPTALGHCRCPGLCPRGNDRSLCLGGGYHVEDPEKLGAALAWRAAYEQQARLLEVQGNAIDVRQARIKVQQLDDMINVMGMQREEEVVGSYIPLHKVLPSPHRRRTETVSTTYTFRNITGGHLYTNRRQLSDYVQLLMPSIKDKKQAVSVQTIYEECGLRYAAIHRNQEALALFRANSTSLVAKKKQMRRKSTMRDEETISPRDPLLNYKKPQLVERLRMAQQQLLERNATAAGNEC